MEQLVERFENQCLVYHSELKEPVVRLPGYQPDDAVPTVTWGPAFHLRMSLPVPGAGARQPSEPDVGLFGPTYGPFHVAPLEIFLALAELAGARVRWGRLEALRTSALEWARPSARECGLLPKNRAS